MKRILASKVKVFCLGTLVSLKKQSKKVHNKKNACGKKEQKSKSFPCNEKVGGKDRNQMSISENCFYLGGLFKNLDM